MCKLGKTFVLICTVVAATSLAVGQPPLQPGGFGGGKGKTDYFSLLQNPAIKGELKVTDQQLEKLPAAALKALAEVLDEKQIKRLKEISLQQRGNAVFLDAEVKKELKISDDQAKKIQEAMDTAQKEQNEMFQSGNFDFEKIQELQKTATDTVQNVLSKEQKAAFEKMVGEPMPKGGFGGKGKKGG